MIQRATLHSTYWRTCLYDPAGWSKVLQRLAHLNLTAIVFTFMRTFFVGNLRLPAAGVRQLVPKQAELNAVVADKVAEALATSSSSTSGRSPPVWSFRSLLLQSEC